MPNGTDILANNGHEAHDMEEDFIAGELRKGGAIVKASVTTKNRKWYGSRVVSAEERKSNMLGPDIPINWALRDLIKTFEEQANQPKGEAEA